jgi:hypothetical protein
MTSTIEEDFELELRSLPGVLNVGISHGAGGEVDAVTLLVRSQDPDAVRDGALQVASLYFPDATVIVEYANSVPPVRESDGSRVALLRAEFHQNDGISEVQLSYAGRIGVGRAASGPLIGGAEATLAALRDLGFVIPFYVMTVTKVDTLTGWSVLVDFRSLSNEDDRIGIARSEGDLVSAARATLDALNRYVTASNERKQPSPQPMASIENGSG